MLLRRLVEFAEASDEMPPPLYAPVNIRYEIRLTAYGQLAHAEPIDLADKKNKRGPKVLAPSVQRAAGVKPILLADNAEYTFGIARENSKPARVRQCHAAYMTLLETCLNHTESSSVNAILHFLNNDPVSQLQLDDEFDPSGNIRFSVAGRNPTDERAVRRFWSGHNQPDTERLQCIVCGENKPALDRLLGKIKGLYGGQAAGTSLISANATAFESYGLSASQVSPICVDCAEGFTQALNYLLASSEHRLSMGNTTYVFWTSELAQNPWASLLSSPTADDIRKYLYALISGQHQEDIDITRFYAVALSANNARAVVRDWIDTTLGRAKQSMRRWFKWQEIVGPWGEEPRALGLYALAAATVRDPQKELTSQTLTTLLRTAVTGVPLPDRLLQQVVRRCQVEQQVTRQHATLIKLVLSSQLSNPEEDFMSQLHPDHPSTAYHCGRLLAVLESIQRNSSDGKLNTTLIDRFYGTASSAPASVFGNLLRGAQPHLAKMRKNDRRKGAAYALEQEMIDVIDKIPAFPSTLVAKEQAVFALGYYHQRAHDRAQAQSHRRATDADDAQTDDE